MNLAGTIYFKMKPFHKYAFKFNKLLFERIITANLKFMQSPFPYLDHLQICYPELHNFKILL